VNNPMKCDCGKNLKLYSVTIGDAEEPVNEWLCPKCEFGEQKLKHTGFSDELLDEMEKNAAEYSQRLGTLQFTTGSAPFSTTTADSGTLTLESIDAAMYPSSSDNYILGDRYLESASGPTLVREKDGSTYWVGIDGKRVAEVDESAD